MTRQINLYNPALRARREWLTGKWLLNGIGILIVLLGLYGGVVRWENQQLNEEAGRIGAELSQRQAELARLNEELAQRKVDKETEAALLRAEAALQGRERVREALDSGALGSSDGFAEFLRAFARQAREGLWMVGLQVAEGGRNITLEGRTQNPDQIPGYIRGLNSETILRGRSFEAMNVRLVDEGDKPASGGARPTEKGEQEGQTAQAGAEKLPPFHEFMLTAAAAGGRAEDRPATGVSR
ncbi:MAG: hypothetical protein HKUEN07_34930 [Rhodocyclaceae bacterium]|jgi:hypothetical protein|uniref:Fimbrial assembly protein n=1 Tax=Candidatus Desulfobacillus denitrificans TaxID=2608985 RepID=A0A809R653_9PROT|nr:hypothetical protein [Rhodocyclaceae bacterium]MCL4723168.1 hypothetical protein [Rhodocyclaceae bacterium]BBO19785.1 conserved hypothetical protein [Candidatus Desulfobacillus denitrificans]GIK45931.1 MAG: hypothetical protein BroJett012_18340 [Betaproteobacteria bacterium]GJQ56924.1 MAG: hypothetical protein HKUEN07_34930 [Rhodocyclaceae bacterium]